MTMSRLALVFLSLLLASCAKAPSIGQGGTPVSASVAPAPTAQIASPAKSPTPVSSATASLVTQPAEVFFTSGGKLAAVSSRVSTSAPARQALEQLLKGPTDSQHSTEIPSSSHLQDVSVQNSTAVVSFDAAFFAPDGATGTLLRLAQVVYTVTQFSGITAVRFLQDGRSIDLIGEGFPLNHPLARQDFPHIQP